ncbi:MAG: glycosyltransferase family 2 protein [Candidatus Neomarinimicrobiota bacterium]|nr:glycosyltransferase family 2 protein [Candidatus Neomarinimicrobiota bacterium]
MNIVSIIIPNYNGGDLLYNCINSIYKNISIKDFEIIVVDNGSTDNSINQIESNFQNVKIVSSNSNLGYSGGCNLGATHASGKYLLFLNNDTEHSNEWIEKLVYFLDSNSNIAAVQPKILNIHNKKLFDYAGGAGGFIDKFCFPFVQGRIFHTLEEDHNQYNNPSRIFWASGAAFMIQSNIFKTLKGFDEVYFAYMEEIDLCWRAQAMGYKIYCVPDSFVYHYGKQTIKENTTKSHYLNHRNSWILFLKNSFTFDYGILIIRRLILDWMALAYSIMTLDIRRFVAILFAQVWILFFTSKIIKLRKNNHVVQLDNIYGKSIAIDYFFKGKKYFSQISLK